MKYLNLFLLATLLLGISCQSEVTTTEEVEPAIARDYYLLRTYTLSNEKQVEMTDTYLRDLYIPALKELGIKEVGVFKARAEETDTIFHTYLHFAFPSLDQLPSFDEALLEDAGYLGKGGDYLTADRDQPPYDRFVNVVLKSFEYMPEMKAPEYTNEKSDRVYELRSYESHNEPTYRNKVDMFNAGGEIELFEKLEFNAVFYGDVIAGPSMPNLMYMTTFETMESREAHWKSFVDAPEWKEMSSLEKYQNNVSSIDIQLLYPAEYSDY